MLLSSRTTCCCRGGEGSPLQGPSSEHCLAGLGCPWAGHACLLPDMTVPNLLPSPEGPWVAPFH